MEMDDKNHTRMKNQITCRTSFEGLSKAIDLPRMILQISATDGDTIILNRRHPRDMVGRFNFRTNIELFVGFLIFASEIFYILIHNEHMNPGTRAVVILFLISGYMIYFLMLELSLWMPRKLPQQEWRQACIIVWLQEAVMITVLVPIVYWILQEPVVILMATPT